MKKIYKFSAILIIALCSNSISNAQNQGPILANKLVNPEPKITHTIKKEHFVWIDGQWKVENNKYIWISGHWTAKKARHVFINGNWKKQNDGWSWEEGYWKKYQINNYKKLYT